MMVRVKKHIKRRTMQPWVLSLIVSVSVVVLMFMNIMNISFLLRMPATTPYNGDDDNNYMSPTYQDNNPDFSVRSPPKSKLRVAVIVAGTLQRFMFNSTLEHLIQPQQHNPHMVMDYYASLTTAKAKAYRSGSGYTDHLQADVTLPRISSSSRDGSIRSDKENSKVNNDDREYDDDDANEYDTIKTYMRTQLESLGASIGTIHIQERIDIDSEPLLQARRAKARHQHPDEDPDTRFPIFDIRYDEIAFRTANANRNLLRMHLAIQHLWTSVLKMEIRQDFKYDYVMFLRDDSLWLEDFHLDHVTAQEGDIYIPSCDARNPPMDHHELNDHILISKRDVSDIFGNYYVTLHTMDVQQCRHTLPSRLQNSGTRGCNSEMLLKYVCDQKGLQVTKVPQSLIPFQRSVNVKLPDGSNTQCFHKFCQSHNMPLQLENHDIQKCKDIDWETIFSQLDDENES